MLRNLVVLLAAGLVAGLIAGGTPSYATAASRDTLVDHGTRRGDGTRLSARTTIWVRKGAGETRSAVDIAAVSAGETITIRNGRIHRGGWSTPAGSRRTWLAVLQGSVTALPGPTAGWKPFAVAAGRQAVFGESEPERSMLDADRARYAAALGRGALPGRSHPRLPAAVRAALSRLNSLAAERLRRKDMAGLRGLAVANCRVGARPLQALIDEVDVLSSMTRRVNVAYRVSDWRSEGTNAAAARYAATLELTPVLVPDLQAAVSLSGTVRYRRGAGAWRFAHFGIDHAAVDSKRLPAAFDRLNDLLVPE